MPVAVAAGRRKREDKMGLFDQQSDPLQEMDKQWVNLTNEQWLKLDAIAEVLAARGVKSPVTKKPVSRADVIREFVANGIKFYEVEHGRIAVSMPAPKSGATKKSASKKGGSK